MSKDEHEGRGGSYIADPKTGKRKLVQRTQEAAAATPTVETPAPETQEGK